MINTIWCGPITVGDNLNNYELNIVSAEKDSKGKKLKKYNINGTDFLGVYENESFEVEFKNNSWKTVQVRISIDGTDIITGKEADLKPAGEMWVCNPYSTIILKAWPETTKGGASFIFGKAADSVAEHTHGNLDSRGIISAAVFTEQEVNYTLTYNQSWYNPPTYRSLGTRICSNTFGGGGTYSANTVSLNSDYETKCAATMDSMDFSEASLPAVGAGEHIDQEIQKVAGLNNPVYQTVLMVKYQWWTKLKSDLRKLGFDKADMSSIGFPGEQKMINLGSTPKKGKQPKLVKKTKKKYIELERFSAA